MRSATLPALSSQGVRRVALLALAVLIACIGQALRAHGVDENDKAFIEGASGVNIIPYIYLGAKHMLTGYDHLLFLAGVIFFLYRSALIGAFRLFHPKKAALNQINFESCSLISHFVV